MVTRCAPIKENRFVTALDLKQMPIIYNITDIARKKCSSISEFQFKILKNISGQCVWQNREMAQNAQCN